jgi:transcriptional regulator with XRE-family HTH domain
MTLKEWRETIGLTQREAAERIGVHPMYVSQIERGRRRPGMKVATRIRDVTGGQVTLDTLAHPPVREAA